VKIFQDARVFVTRLDASREAPITLAPGRAGYLQVASGTVVLEGQTLHAGDGVRIEGASARVLAAALPSEALFFDLA
jgi:redox-sensitive bicupin YhaK (pirin superfamily)